MPLGVLGLRRENQEEKVAEAAEVLSGVGLVDADAAHAARPGGGAGIDVGDEGPADLGGIDAEFWWDPVIAGEAVGAVDAKHLRRAIVDVPGVGVDLPDGAGTLKIKEKPAGDGFGGEEE